MKQEYKDLLLKDLCGRLPYGVKLQYESQYGSTYIGPLTNINLHRVTFGGICKDILEVKPYLFPLSSMTEEQKIEHTILWENTFIHRLECCMNKLYNFYKENHLDDNGLIPMGLALDATGKNIY